MTTDDLANAKQQLMRHEGLRTRVYKDSLGIETIGCGRNLRDKGITASEAMDLLDHDIDECLLDLRSFPWFASLDTVRQIALLDLRFNLGGAKLRTFKGLLGAMAAGDYGTAAKQLETSLWAHQVQPARVKCVVGEIRDGVLG